MKGNSPGVPDGSELGHEPVAGVERRESAIVVHLQGELDLYNAEALRAALVSCCEGAPEQVVVDLAEVRFVDSTALGVLIEASSRLGDSRRLVLAAPGLETRRALEISGLDRHFTVSASVEEALA
jgi:anti-anti-sigma factor